MNIFIEAAVEFFLTLLGLHSNEVCKDHEVPKFAKVVFLLLAIILISWVLFFYCKVSE